MEGKYKEWAQAAIKDRYQYLRHMYTCLFEVSQWGGSCIDPLFYHFPTDDNVYKDTSSSFMIGGALKVTPVLEALGDKKTFTTYFPKGRWVNLANPSEIVGSNDKGMDVALNAQQPTVNVHLRPGSLIPWQDYKMTKAMTTADLVKQPISLIANRDTNGHAQGSLVINKGEEI